MHVLYKSTGIQTCIAASRVGSALPYRMQKVQAQVNVATTKRKKGIKDLKGTDDIGASACLERVCPL